MIEQIPLRLLYEEAKNKFPSYQHDEVIFQKNVVAVLELDRIRTRTQRIEIETSGLEYQIKSHYPMNDFISGAYHYLCKIGVPYDEAVWFRVVTTDKNFFQE